MMTVSHSGFNACCGYNVVFPYFLFLISTVSSISRRYMPVMGFDLVMISVMKTVNSPKPPNTGHPEVLLEDLFGSTGPEYGSFFFLNG